MVSSNFKQKIFFWSVKTNNKFLWFEWKLKRLMSNKAMRLPEIFGLLTFPKLRKSGILAVENFPVQNPCFGVRNFPEKYPKIFPKIRFRTPVQNTSKPVKLLGTQVMNLDCNWTYKNTQYWPQDNLYFTSHAVKFEKCRSLDEV